MAREPLKVGLAGLGAVGLEVARRIEAGIPGLVLAADFGARPEKARRNLPQAGDRHCDRFRPKSWRETCDVVVECLPPALFRTVAVPAIERGRMFMPLSVGQLLENWDLVTRAKETGARILVPTGALIGLDAVRAAAEGTIRSVTMITRKPPGGLEGAPYLVERGISVKNLQEPLKVFDGTAREGARGFPENVNVAAALSLAGIGPDRTRLEIWADPALDRNTHRIEVDADTAQLFHGDRERAVGKSENRPHRRAEHGRGVARARGGAEGRDVTARQPLSLTAATCGVSCRDCEVLLTTD